MTVVRDPWNGEERKTSLDLTGSLRVHSVPMFVRSVHTEIESSREIGYVK